MQNIDYSIIQALNTWAHRWPLLDSGVWILATNFVFKTSVVAPSIAWLWFTPGPKQQANRRLLVAGVYGAWLAVAVARALSLVLPFRERPLRNPDLHFTLPFQTSADAILGWSSFPSDNATLHFGLAAVLFTVSRPLGLLAFLQAFISVAFARVYEGWHYPSDILLGAMIGIFTVKMLQSPRLAFRVSRGTMLLEEATPELFYSIAVFMLILTATTFEPLYPLARIAIKLTHLILNG